MESNRVRAVMRLKPETEALLRCPACRGELAGDETGFLCHGNCRRRYPLMNCVPILIDEERSVFTIDTFVREQATFFPKRGRLFRLLRSLVPATSAKPKTKRNLARLRELLGRTRRVLIVGGSIRGLGIEVLDTPDVELVETDAALGPFTAVVCDAHSIPFADESFDAVIAQCVLEHVADPFLCAEEIWRVLGPGGCVYAETAFVQQVHGGAYDFIRFTHLGHRRLFRRFDEIDSGAVAGPATALAWSYEHLLLSLVGKSRLRNPAKAFARISAFPLKYLDHLLIDRPAALDAASSVYFLGRKSDASMKDSELLRLYRGAG
jgi:SAM-dependent methyltransferase